MLAATRMHTDSGCTRGAHGTGVLAGLVLVDGRTCASARTAGVRVCTYYLDARVYVLSQLVRCIGLHSSTQHQHGVGLDADHEQDDVGRRSSTVTW